VPNKKVEHEPGEWIACTKEVWEERQSLAYFINMHILSKRTWGPESVCNEIGNLFIDAWYPGAIISRVRTDPPSSLSHGRVPYNSHEDFLLNLGGPSAGHGLLLDDTKLEDYDDIWTIQPGTLQAHRFLHGRMIWITAFDKYWKKQWRTIATTIQQELQLTHGDVWRAGHPTPDEVCDWKFPIREHTADGLAAVS